MSLVQIQEAETTPINGLNNYNGKTNYQIIFELVGAPNQMIDLNSLRFCYDLNYLLGNNTHLNNSNVDRRAGYVANTYVGSDDRVGANAIINSIVFEDANNNILEQVNNYGHLMSKVSSMSLSQDDMITWTGSLYGIFGGAKMVINNMALNSCVPMCHRLYTGITNSAPMPFSVVGGKLRVIINITNPTQVFFGGVLNPLDIGTNNQAVLNGGAYFDIKNIRAVYKVVNLPQNAPVAKGGYSYKHFSSFNQTLQSSSYQNIYNFNLSNVKSVLNTFIRSNKINNYNANSFQGTKLMNGDTGLAFQNLNDPNIFESSVLKNNVKFPLDFSVDETAINNETDVRPNYDVGRAYYYMSSLRPLATLNNTLICPATERYGGFYQPEDPDPFNNVYGIGMNYDSMTYGTGSSFNSGNNYLQKINSGVNGLVPNEIFTSVLSVKKLIPTSSGVVLQN